MREQIHNQEIEDPWKAWNKALESYEHFKKEVAPGLTFMCNELESDIIEK